MRGWGQMVDLMLSGYSWSGRERDCCFLNLRDGSFADVSALAGVDDPGDGRALAVCDWDGDGDLDLWLKSRTGPQLRFWRNENLSGHHFLALRLVGRECNRGAIGARAVVEVAGRKIRRDVVAGDGYLAQSSKWLHFGLGRDEKIERVVVRWPGGKTAEYRDLAADRRYRLEQGSDKAVEVPLRRIGIEHRPADSPSPPATARVVLKGPLPLAPVIRRALGLRDGPATLVSLWAHWCSPCLIELKSLADGAEGLAAAGATVRAVNVDREPDRPKAAALFSSQFDAAWKKAGFAALQAPPDLLESLDAVIRHVRDRDGMTSLPMSLLVDGHGVLQIVYVGPVEPRSVVDDVKLFCSGQLPEHQRSNFPGRWYFRVPRNLPALTKDLQDRGLGEAAEFYRALQRGLESAGR